MKYPTREELQELDPVERLQLIEDLWDSLSDDADLLPVSDEHRRELDRRLEELARAPEAGVTWPDLRTRLQRRS
jgi:putative addiction module component (TIGR02574 family)